MASIHDLTNVNFDTSATIVIANNPNLSCCTMPNLCNYLNNSNNAYVLGNAQGCIDKTQIVEGCNGTFFGWVPLMPTGPPYPTGPAAWYPIPMPK